MKGRPLKARKKRTEMQIGQEVRGRALEGATNAYLRRNCNAQHRGYSVHGTYCAGSLIGNSGRELWNTLYRLFMGLCDLHLLLTLDEPYFPKRDVECVQVVYVLPGIGNTSIDAHQRDIS